MGAAGADEPAEAPEPAVRRQDRRGPRALDCDGLRVHRDVERAVRGSERDQRRDDRRQAPGDERQRKRQHEEAGGGGLHDDAASVGRATGARACHLDVMGDAACPRYDTRSASLGN